MDESPFAPPKKSCNDNSLANTNKQYGFLSFQSGAKWIAQPGNVFLQGATTKMGVCPRQLEKHNQNSLPSMSQAHSPSSVVDG